MLDEPPRRSNRTSKAIDYNVDTTLAKLCGDPVRKKPVRRKRDQWGGSSSEEESELWASDESHGRKRRKRKDDDFEESAEETGSSEEESEEDEDEPLPLVNKTLRQLSKEVSRRHTEESEDEESEDEESKDEDGESTEEKSEEESEDESEEESFWFEDEEREKAQKRVRRRQHQGSDDSEADSSGRLSKDPDLRESSAMSPAWQAPLSPPKPIFGASSRAPEDHSGIKSAYDDLFAKVVSPGTLLQQRGRPLKPKANKPGLSAPRLATSEGLPDGWETQKSRSRPGQVTYVNMYNGERHKERPTRPPKQHRIKTANREKEPKTSTQVRSRSSLSHNSRKSADSERSESGTSERKVTGPVSLQYYKADEYKPLEIMPRKMSGHLTLGMPVAEEEPGQDPLWGQVVKILKQGPGSLDMYRIEWDNGEFREVSHAEATGMARTARLLKRRWG